MKINNFDIKVIRSKRKSIALQITKELDIIVRAPDYATNKQIEEFVAEKSQWLEKHLESIKGKIEQEKCNPVQKFTIDEINQLADKALIEIPGRVAHYAPIVGVGYGKITIRNQTSRWGSCSDKGNLNFNCLLMLTPDYVVDYVVVHELCHRLEMNHSKKFWNEVKRVLPDYENAKKWLKENEEELIKRMR